MSFIGTLFGLESGGRNVANTTEGTSSGQAQGYYQITTGTWQDFAPRAGVDLSQYPTPLSAPLSVQSAVAGNIPMSRWAASTLQGLEAAGYTIDPSATLAQNAAANGAALPTDPSQTGLSGAAATLLGGTQAASGATGGGGIAGALSDLVQWVERGFLIIVGLAIVIFGLWHLSNPSEP